MKILITGCNGQLGYDVVSVLSTEHILLSRGHLEMDICNYSCVEGIIKTFMPEVIVNCAAFTKVDKCETEKDLAWQVNVKGPENLARCAEKYGGRLIHISTDYVFDGKRDYPHPYIESDEPSPISIYGKTKLEGEKAIINTTNRYVILRTAWLYGINGHNFLKTMLRLALTKSEQKIKVVNDQYGSPTWSYRLACQISSIIEVRSSGIFHTTAEGYCTWYQFARYFLERMEIHHNIIPCTTAEYPTPATRPMNSILYNSRLKSEGINQMVDWNKDVDEFVNFYRNTLIKEAMSEI